MGQNLQADLLNNVHTYCLPETTQFGRITHVGAGADLEGPNGSSPLLVSSRIRQCAAFYVSYP